MGWGNEIDRFREMGDKNDMRNYDCISNGKGMWQQACKYMGKCQYENVILENFQLYKKNENQTSKLSSNLQCQY